MSKQMATGIFVQCKTDKMPGEHIEKIPLMANTACRRVWNRDFNKNDPNNDRLTTFGGWMNPRCFLLVDNGPVDEAYNLVRFRWDGQKLVDDTGPLHAYIQKEFATRYQFNPAHRPKETGHTDEEFNKFLNLKHMTESSNPEMR